MQYSSMGSADIVSSMAAYRLQVPALLCAYTVMRSGLPEFCVSKFFHGFSGICMPSGPPHTVNGCPLIEENSATQAVHESTSAKLSGAILGGKRMAEKSGLILGVVSTAAHAPLIVARSGRQPHTTAAITKTTTKKTLFMILTFKWVCASEN